MMAVVTGLLLLGEVCWLLQSCLVVPAAVATDERSFSAVKTNDSSPSLCSAMTSECLSSTAAHKKELAEGPPENHRTPPGQCPVCRGAAAEGTETWCPRRRRFCVDWALCSTPCDISDVATND